MTTDKKRYILQKMNTRVFPDSDALMKNICAVTEYLKGCGAETLDVIPTITGEKYLRGEDNFRMYAFIENTVTYQLATDKDVFEESGRAFGQFQNLLASFDASVLSETIPQFHDTPKRYRDFCAALEKDAFDRAKAISRHAQALPRFLRRARKGRVRPRETVPSRNRILACTQGYPIQNRGRAERRLRSPACNA